MRGITLCEVNRIRIKSDKQRFSASSLQSRPGTLVHTSVARRPFRRSFAKSAIPLIQQNPRVTRISQSYSTITTMPSTDTPFLVRFFDPEIHEQDHYSRTLGDILSWPDEDLEFSHNYIQFVFPLPESSDFNSRAPIVTKEVREAFLADPRLQNELRQVYVRILHFYGLQLEQNGEIGKAADFATASRAWRRRFDHNHLRITRILRSLRVLGLQREAEQFYTALLEHGEGGEVGTRTKMYWNRAVGRPLHLPPDHDDEDAVGIAWLKGVENQ